MRILTFFLLSIFTSSFSVAQEEEHSYLLGSWKRLLDKSVDPSRQRFDLYNYIHNPPRGTSVKLQQSFDILHKIALESREFKVGDDISSELFALNQEFIETSENKWSNKLEWEGVSVYQNDNLYDMHRFDYHLPRFQTREYEGLTFINTDPNTVFLPTYGATHARMEKGLAPVGEDGELILLCRIVDHPLASLYELNKSDAIRLLSNVRSEMTYTESCVSERGSSHYWRLRYQSFHDKNGARYK